MQIPWIIFPRLKNDRPDLSFPKARQTNADTAAANFQITEKATFFLRRNELLDVRRVEVRVVAQQDALIFEFEPFVYTQPRASFKLTDAPGLVVAWTVPVNFLRVYVSYVGGDDFAVADKGAHGSDSMRLATDERFGAVKWIDDKVDVVRWVCARNV